MQSGLAKKLKEARFPVDSKKFKPHITLAREMHIERIDRNDLLSQSFSCKASHISLMLSSRPDGKLTYAELYRR